ncbi:MAG: CoB--CoM heterodisulfide reductase iron-sulfur subunit B family protein [Bacteroidota bacterium]|nr:CoB--CoM heterodisulfide reductase iron-sulfur subunit B family protein [Bacteroidota bacterium]
MEIGYYPGCSLEGTAKEFDKSLKEVLKVLDVNLKEIEDWSCCGASSAHSAGNTLAIALPARNLKLADDQGLKEIVAPCAACFNRLVTAKHELKFDESMRIKVEKLLEEKTSFNADIYNILQLFQKIGMDKIKENVKINLKNLKVACYYGCLLVRPNDIIQFDDTENPLSMEEIVMASGAQPVNWNFKTECCGASLSIVHTGIVEKLSKQIMDNAILHKADIIAVACPMCHSNLDMRQLNIKKDYPGHKEIPVVYISELVGLALGIDPAKLGLNSHFIDPMKVLNSAITEEAAI